MRQKIRSEKSEYEKNPGLWTNKGDELTVIGDFLGRLPSIELLDPKPGEVVLDAGCGAGFCSRIIARLGAKVFGCDRAKKMLAQARRHENEDPLDIKYSLSEITSLSYADRTFDAVFCVAVLMHDSPTECEKFFREAWRVLKPNGRIIISITHTRTYLENQNKESSWAEYTPLEDGSETESKRFEEVYRDSLGNIFTSTVWCHPENMLADLLTKAGFTVKHEQKKFITREILKVCNQTGKVGYPGFQQVLAAK